MKRLALLSAALILTVAGVAIANSGAVLPVDAHCVEVTELEVWVCGTTTTAAPTTTTTAATTTTVAPTTTVALTTTSAPTTTQAPTTTTATPVIPATVPAPRITADLGNGFIFQMGANEDGDTGFERFFWNAPYVGRNDVDVVGQELPYTPVFMWWPGDRIAYDCIYSHLRDASGEIVGRVTAVAIQAPANVPTWGAINDRFMKEGLFFWNGDSTNGDPPEGYAGGPGQAYHVSWCQDPNVVTTDYGTNTQADQRPRIVYWVDGEPVEIRDYRGTVLLTPGGHFRVTQVITDPFVSSDGAGRQIVVTSRVAVTFFDQGNSAIVFYYDGIGAGEVTVDFP